MQVVQARHVEWHGAADRRIRDAKVVCRLVVVCAVTRTLYKVRYVTQRGACRCCQQV